MFPMIVTTEKAERLANGMMKPPSVDVMDRREWSPTSGPLMSAGAHW
jgi:hypothetical protein